MLWVCRLNSKISPAQARSSESTGMPIFCAIWSAVLKPDGQATGCDQWDVELGKVLDVLVSGKSSVGVNTP